MTTPDPRAAPWLPAAAMASGEGYIGAKAAFFYGTRLLCYLRDVKPGLPWPGHWDLPGGGREGQESPVSCQLRELEEEFGLRLPAERLLIGLPLPAMRGDGIGWFFAGRLTEADLAQIRFGDEGQYWQAMEVQDYLAHPLAIPPLQDRVRQVMEALPALVSR